ncbi:hypothetical protein GBA52_005392 [Prunus armeniaca]|nr:hypothetical protein GBA52_005350 [Prunus armeniaca]KAH0993909.1 hypothetical protein GBA52_005392 [Prunus armeniaca]
MDSVKDQGDEALYNKLDSSYPTDDEDSEEGDAYLETYNSENDGEDEGNFAICNPHLETNFPYFENQDSQTELEVPQHHLHAVPTNSCAGSDQDEERDSLQ